MTEKSKGLLVLARKPGESVVICGNITITVLEIHGQQVKLSFAAPRDIHIVRSELLGHGQDGGKHESSSRPQ